jgi:hypothetical protein
LKSLKNKDKNIIRFEGAFHEVFEDPEHGKSYHNEIVSWISNH